MIHKNKMSILSRGLKTGSFLGLLAIASVSANEGTLEAGNTFVPGTAKIFETSKSVRDQGFVEGDAITFKDGELSDGVVIDLDATVAKQRQTIDGIGGAMTESTTFLISTLSDDERDDVMKEIFSPEGSWYSMVRISIASCDFSLGTYAYSEKVDLSDFSIDRDTHVTIPRLKQAKELAGGWDELRIVASPWGAPPSMKQKSGKEDAKFDQTGGYAGGELNPLYKQNFADYVVKFIQGYEAEGVEMWGMTPLNEPHGNGSNWDSMLMTGSEQADYVGEYLHPTLVEEGYGHLGIYGFDQNKSYQQRDVEFVADMLEGDKELAMDKKAFAGIGLHWYFSTYNTYADKLDDWHEQYPDYKLLATEATIDNLRADNAGEGKTGYGPLLEINNLVPGVADIEPQADCDNAKCQQDDPNSKYNVRYPWANSPDRWDWWFERVHGSWAFEVTADWGKDAAAVSPLTEPFFHYGRDIIHSFNHWVTGWIDWNIVLNEQGGPNWAKNWCTAPITITSEGEVIYNPTFYLFRHFSKFIRPGSKIIDVFTDFEGSNKSTMDNSGHNISSEYFLEVTAAINPEGKVVIVIMNDENTETDYSINLAGKSFTGSIQANAMQTILVEDEFVSESSSSVEPNSSDAISSGESDDSSVNASSSEGTGDDSSVGDDDSSDDSESSEDGNSSISPIVNAPKFAPNTAMFSRLVQGSTIKYSVATTGAYTLNIFDITGKKVATLGTIASNEGVNELPVGNTPLGDGMYFIAAKKIN
ncbi:MAG: hypothetical protein OCD01_09705 [Fibrobacterales bacterium]